MLFEISQSVLCQGAVLALTSFLICIWKNIIGYDKIAVQGGGFMDKLYKDKTYGFNMLSDKAVSIWRIRATAVLILFSFLVGAVFVFYEIFAVIFGIMGLCAYIFIVLFYFPMLYRICGYSAENNVVIIHKGYFFQRHIKLYFSRVQYCVISQDPIQRFYGVCSIRFLTAGSSEIINDISVYNAQKIKISVEE